MYVGNIQLLLAIRVLRYLPEFSNVGKLGCLRCCVVVVVSYFACMQLLVEINKLYLVSTNGEYTDRLESGELKNSRSSFKAVNFFFLFGSLERRIIGW